jgi:hypothetical protein
VTALSLSSEEHEVTAQAIPIMQLTKNILMLCFILF